ncbi:hypothetical protein [Hyalangium versicolor]|uniref:hypothetical protein n=1 Tax=Hyalangium versicolor TaxID=2861190 RepID=UPI001CCC7CFC|nr:hypothetical protein [Hyalangium versicolor]
MSRALFLAPLFLLLSCSDRDYCAEAPLCEKDQAINCERSCSVGPCSTGANIVECGPTASCEFVIGDTTSPRFFRSRALCIEEGSASCDPDTSGPPVCDGQGLLMGCSGYKRIIRASCSQAALYFTSSDCCRSGTPSDGGVPDGGSPDAGP